ncbi:hypothetical protein B9N43_01580 [Denitratisoma sp. DHT3]|nr:hypothetical protein B9N43_01580 [Denitratisoma sp. DHT3]
MGGLRGAYYFDDYGQIVWNAGLSMRELNWKEFLAAATSSDAGPLGRPVAMGSFALEQYFWGTEPDHFKLVNLFIHLANSLLLALLTTELVRALPRTPGQRGLAPAEKILILAVTAWWAFHPLGVTGVLYIVQRMTSLSALFSFFALWGYLRWRRKSLESGRSGDLITAMAVLLVGGLLSLLTKENGALTFGFAWLTEVLVLRFRGATAGQERFLRTLGLLGPILAALAVLAFWLEYPGWLNSLYADRAFTLEQRLLTEARVLWFYLRQIVLPSSTAMGLYHDGFPLSLGLFQPWTTALAILGHISLLALGWWLRRRQPLAAFGIAWFYLGHATESTVIPLELVFEHRNYLPQYGILLASAYLMVWRSRVFWKARIGLLCGLIFLALINTALRAQAMGEKVAYPVYEAVRHPESSRANFDAGLIIAGAIGQNAQLVNEYYAQSHQFFDRSRSADPHTLAPFVGMMKLSSVSGVPYPPDYLDEFERRLRNGVPPRASSFIPRILGEQLSASKPILSIEDGRRLYQAAIENRLLTGYPRACWEAGYGLFLFNIVGDRANGLVLMRAAVADAPSHADLWVFLAAMLISSGDAESAERAIDEAQRQDRKGYSSDDLAKLRNGLELLKSGKHAIQ